MRYMIVIEEGENSFGAYVPDLLGCVAVAETEEDLAETPKPLSKSEYVEVLVA